MSTRFSEIGLASSRHERIARICYASAKRVPDLLKIEQTCMYLSCSQSYKGHDVQKYHEIGFLNLNSVMLNVFACKKCHSKIKTHSVYSLIDLSRSHYQAVRKTQVLFEGNLEVSFTSARNCHESYYVSTTVSLSLYVLFLHDDIDIL